MKNYFLNVFEKIKKLMKNYFLNVFEEIKKHWATVTGKIVIITLLFLIIISAVVVGTVININVSKTNKNTINSKNFITNIIFNKEQITKDVNDYLKTKHYYMHAKKEVIFTSNVSGSISKWNIDLKPNVSSDPDITTTVNWVNKCNNDDINNVILKKYSQYQPKDQNTINLSAYEIADDINNYLKNSVFNWNNVKNQKVIFTLKKDSLQGDSGKWQATLNSSIKGDKDINLVLAWTTICNNNDIFTQIKNSGYKLTNLNKNDIVKYINWYLSIFSNNLWYRNDDKDFNRLTLNLVSVSGKPGQWNITLKSNYQSDKKNNPDKNFSVLVKWTNQTIKKDLVTEINKAGYLIWRNRSGHDFGNIKLPTPSIFFNKVDSRWNSDYLWIPKFAWFNLQVNTLYNSNMSKDTPKVNSIIEASHTLDINTHTANITNKSFEISLLKTFFINNKNKNSYSFSQEIFIETWCVLSIYHFTDNISSTNKQNIINRKTINDELFPILAKSNNQNVYISNMFFSIWSSNCDFSTAIGGFEQFRSDTEISLKSFNWFY